MAMMEAGVLLANLGFKLELAGQAMFSFNHHLGRGWVRRLPFALSPGRYDIAFCVYDFDGRNLKQLGVPDPDLVQFRKIVGPIPSKYPKLGIDGSQWRVLRP